MPTNFQLIPFPAPRYLATFMSHQLNTTIELHQDTIKCIPINRFSVLGRSILKIVEVANHKPKIENSELYFLKVSNFSGNNYQTARGTTHFLTIDQEKISFLIDQVKADFDESLLAFVSGAEFVHKKNGWHPNQKRAGIRKKAILKFCELHQVDFSKQNLDSFVKMVQRNKKANNKRATNLQKKLCQTLSF